VRSGCGCVDAGTTQPSEVRLRLCRRGDYPTDRLDKLRARLVKAEAQAELLAELLEAGCLRADELSVVGRARNAAVNRTGARRGIREYRAATALEALIAWWIVGGETARFEALIIPAIEARIDGLFAPATAK
jgi:ribonuclease-3 family protein